MGIFSKLFGGDGRQYVDAGTRLAFSLPLSLRLPDWHEGIPDYTVEEDAAIGMGMSNFQFLADQELGGKAAFHPDAAPVIQRKIAGDALFELGREYFNDLTEEAPLDWRPIANSFLKSWVISLNPRCLLSLGDLLAKVGRTNEAREVFNVVLLFPAYAPTLWGENNNDLTVTVVSMAKESLAKLN